MEEMFEVHSSLGSLGQESCRAFPCTLNARLPPLGDLPASYPPLSARQKSRAFNQPLNFDTSNVVNMDEMFEAHSARRILWPILLPSLPLFARCIMRFAPPLSDPPASMLPF